MSTTAALPVAAEVEQWLSRFDAALTQGDTDAAVELFEPDSYWRDLVALTWNITTVEGQAGVRHMLEHTLSRTQPQQWGVVEETPILSGRLITLIIMELEVSLVLLLSRYYLFNKVSNMIKILK